METGFENIAVTVIGPHFLLVEMLSAELAKFYGVSDQVSCAEFVTFINGMLSYAEPTRRECWGQLCLGLLDVQTRLDELQAKHTQLEGKYNARKSQTNELALQLKESVECSQKLNEANRDYILQIESLKSQLSGVAKSTDTDQSEAPKAKRSMPPASVTSVEPPAKRDKPNECSQIVPKAVGEIEYLRMENERLDGLLKAATDFVVPVDALKGRLSAEDVVKMRKNHVALTEQLKSMSEEARRMAYKYTDYIRDHDVAHEKERQEWKRKLEDLKKNVQQPQGVSIPRVFLFSSGTATVCPVPTRSGHVIQLSDVYQHWVRFPCDNEGTVFASFPCPFTGQLTSLSSMEQVNLIYNIAADLQLFMTPPLRFQYLISGKWIDFLFVDQIAIASVCCKLYRQGIGRVVEKVLVCHGDFLFSIHITNDVLDFQMQPVHNTGKITPACLQEAVPGFFQRWVFQSIPGLDAPPTGEGDQ